MNKNIVVTLIAGSFFAASLVAPAFATNTTPEALSQQVAPSVASNVALPDVKLPNRIPSIDVLVERLKNLDLEAIINRDQAVKAPLPGPIVLPDIESVPDLEPVEPITLPEPVVLPAEPVVQPENVEVPEAEPVVEPTVETTETRVPVKDIVAETKAEKASILAAHGGDRRAAKAELKAAQMRMVERIKANNGRGKGKANKGKRNS